MTTLVLIRHHEINGRQFHHGDELPPRTLSQDEIGQWLDRKWLIEYDAVNRRSLYRLFPAFSGAKEREVLTREELTAFTLSS